jgi:hypothetical protein
MIRPADADALLARFTASALEDARTEGGSPSRLFEADTPLVGYWLDRNGDASPIAWTWDDLREYIEEMA